jgi:hypothetical protein
MIVAHGFRRRSDYTARRSLDTRLLLFTLSITCLTAVLFGMIPAFRATKFELTESLKDGRQMPDEDPTLKDACYHTNRLILWFFR